MQDFPLDFLLPRRFAPRRSEFVSNPASPTTQKNTALSGGAFFG